MRGVIMGSNPKILIVDDEERFRTTLGKLLTVRGMDVNTVSGGKLALEELNSGNYDVVLLDIKMPEMDGVEALGKIKELNPLLEVIILTGHASVDVAVEIMRLGGYEYLLKPCPIDELMAKIDTAFERKTAREQRARKAASDVEPKAS
jgi:DNA-binding NtrC family response regulator